MKTLEKLHLKKSEQKALQELKMQLLKRFPGVEVILFGSKARGDADEESDLDVLILIDSTISRQLKEELTWITYDLALKYDVVFGTIIESKTFWDSPLAHAMPLHWSIDREGVQV